MPKTTTKQANVLRLTPSGFTRRPRRFAFRGSNRSILAAVRALDPGLLRSIIEVLDTAHPRTLSRRFGVSEAIIRSIVRDEPWDYLRDFYEPYQPPPPAPSTSKFEPLEKNVLHAPPLAPWLKKIGRPRKVPSTSAST
jgi:hypothetical protein